MIDPKLLDSKFCGPFVLEGFVKVKGKRPPITSPKPFEDHFVNLSNVVEIANSHIYMLDGQVLCLEEDAYKFLCEFIMMGSIGEEKGIYLWQ